MVLWHFTLYTVKEIEEVVAFHFCFHWESDCPSELLNGYLVNPVFSCKNVKDSFFTHQNILLDHQSTSQT